MVPLVDVIFLVDVVLVHVVSHVDVSEGILQLGVVVPWNCTEWVEQIWVHCLCLDHVVQVFLELPLLLLLCVRHIDEAVCTCKEWVEKKMRVVVYTAESTQRVS